MTDPGLADRIRHAARESDPAARFNQRVTFVGDRLTVEQRGWRYSSESRYRVLGAWQGFRPDRLLAVWFLCVWWTREGLRCR